MSEPAACPECGSKRLYRAGFRYLADGKEVQRWLCRDCGTRFTPHKKPESATEAETKPLYCQPAYSSRRRVCELLQESKNLTENARQELAQREGTASTLDVRGRIVEMLFQLERDGLKPNTLINYRKSLNRLLREGADLFNPENTKEKLARTAIKDSTKRNIVAILDNWFKFNGINWKPPKYSNQHEIPYIPSEAQLDLLIAALGQKTACFCQMLKETGARAGEIAQLKWDAIDFEQRKVRIKAEKDSNPRIMPLSTKVIEMINRMPKNKNPQRKEYLFSNADDMRTTFFLQRKRIAIRQASPAVLRIHFHTFRHWKATTEQHKTKDPWHVKMILGHKSIKSTETYIHIEKMMFEGDTYDQFTVKVADTIDEAVKLMEVGFEYHAEVAGHKLFRKRK